MLEGADVGAMVGGATAAGHLVATATAVATASECPANLTLDLWLVVAGVE